MVIKLFKRAGFIGVIIGVILFFTVKSLAFLPKQHLEIKSLDTPLTIESKDSEDFTKNTKVKTSIPDTLYYDWGTDSFDITGDKEFSKFHFVLNAPGVFSEVRSDVQSAKSVGVNLNTLIIRGAKDNFYFSINTIKGFSYVIQGKMKNNNIMDNTIQAYVDGEDNTLNVTTNNFIGKVKVLRDGKLMTEEKLKNVNNFVCNYLPDTKTINVNAKKARCPEICADVD